MIIQEVVGNGAEFPNSNKHSHIGKLVFRLTAVPGIQTLTITCTGAFTTSAGILSSKLSKNPAVKLLF